MTQKQAEYFKIAYELKNITAAAEKLYVSRSALSYAIAELESEYDSSLFTRTTTGIEPTEAANLLYEMIVRNENEMKLLLRRMQALNSKEKIKRIDVAVSITNDSTIIPMLYDGFISLHPEIDVRVIDLPANETPKAIYEGRVKVGICPARVKNFPQLDYAKLFDVKTELAIARTHPLADKTSLTGADLADLPIAAVGQIPKMMMDDLINLAAPFGKEPKIVAQLADWSLVKFLVQRGYAAAYVPTNISASWQGVVSKPILGMERLSTQKIIWCKDLSRNDPAWELIDYIKGSFVYKTE